MRFGLRLLVLCACLGLVPSAARAILIETAAKQRIGGFLEREDAEQITVRVKLPDGKEKTEVFDKAKIKILHQVDRARLQKLNKDKPQAYQDYADELAEKTNDPEAVELAQRLYLIAAYLDPANRGRSCLTNMSALARRPADARKFQALAFLLDAKGNADLLKIEPKKGPATVSPAAKASLKALTDFQKALRYYRAGDSKRAKEYANEKGVADYFAKAGIKDQKSFLQACMDVDCSKCKAGTLNCATCNGKKVTDPFGNGMFQPCTDCNGKGTQKCTACDGFGHHPIPDDYLKSILRAEIWAIDQTLPSDPNSNKNSAASWSSAVGNTQSTIPLLTLENITEFDPRKCLYRNGRWEAP